MASITDRLKHAWNAFSNNPDPLKTRIPEGAYGSYYSGRPHRQPTRFSNEKSIISSIYTRLAIDVAAIGMQHVRTDDQKRYLEDIESGLNNCLTLEANMDQAARAFRQDIVMTLFDKGCAAIVPVDTTLNPTLSGGFDIKTMRVGEIMMWYPKHVRVSLYNEATGLREELVLPKSTVAIIENPLYSVMNEPNSTLQRLIRKLGLLDAVDEASASGNLDIIIQVPYAIKSDMQRERAAQRKADLEFQLKGSAHGIAYADATEKIVQLNRPVENNLMGQIEFLTTMLYSQLGLTEAVMNGTADEMSMRNYHNRTIEPLLDAIVEAMRRTFLTKTARTQGQTIMYFRDPFKFVPIGGEGGIADIADKFGRNEITSSNEIRQAIGMKPRPEPKADALVNANMPQADTGVDVDEADPEADALDSELDEIERELDNALA